MAKKKKQQVAHPVAQPMDVAIFAVRLAITIIVSVLLYLEVRVTGTPALQTLAIAFVVALVMNLLMIVFSMIPALSNYTAWAVIAGDIVTVGTYTAMIEMDPMLTLLFVGGLALNSQIRLGAQLGLLNAALLVTTLIGVMTWTMGGVANLRALPLTAYELPALVFGIMLIGNAVVLSQRDRQLDASHSNIRMEAESRLTLVQNMQERTVAITEMAQMLSSTLNYQRVLDAALNIGRLALQDKTTSSFVAAVMLYSPDDRSLYVETARGLSRADDNRKVRGRAGLVADTLHLCEPIFAGSVRQDPELRQFRSFRNARSVVTVPLRAGYDNYGLMIFASQEPFAFDERYQNFLEAIGIQTTIALQNAVLYQNLADEKERIVEVEEAARHKLARDLHDGPTQAISSIAMRMSIVKSMLNSDISKVEKELDKIEEIAYKTTTEIRGMLFTLRPLALESKGLDAALQQLAEKMDAIYDQKVEVTVSPAAESVMTQHQSGTIFYIIEEAVNNARKHAQSAVIRVRVTLYEDVILVEIADQGVGFDLKAVQDNYEGRSSLGMVNLHERSELIEGTLSIESQPGRGTTISVVVPVNPAGTNEKANTQPSRKQMTENTSKGRFNLHAIR
jgi:signal transduction histidine kinase